MRHARGGACAVSFTNHDRDSRQGVRPVDLHSIVYSSRFYRAGRSCTPITAPTTSSQLQAGGDTLVFAARQVSRGYPAQNAYRVYRAHQGRPGSQAWPN